MIRGFAGVFRVENDLQMIVVDLCIFNLLLFSFQYAFTLQIIVALSTADSKHMAASNALRAFTSLADVVREAHKYGLCIKGGHTASHKKLFEDNTKC